MVIHFFVDYAQHFFNFYRFLSLSFHGCHGVSSLFSIQFIFLILVATLSVISSLDIICMYMNMHIWM